MTLAELRKALASWCTEDAGLVITDSGKDDEHDLVLEVEERSAAAVAMTVARRSRGDRLTITAEAGVRAAAVDPPDPSLPAFAEVLERVLEARPATVTGRVIKRRDTYRVAVEGVVHLDGMGRQAFATVAAEVARTRRLVDRAVADAAAQREILERLGGIGREAGDAAAPERDERPAPQEVSWVPTHVVPAAGMQSWPEPDPSLPQTDLAAGVELVVDEWRGAWARVRGSNGWTGWVDGRRLEER